MIVKAIHAIWAGEYGRHEPGAVFELPADAAASLLTLGAVEAAEASPSVSQPSAETEAAPAAEAPKRKPKP